MADDATATATVEDLEREDQKSSAWSSMDADARDKYVAELHEKMQADKADEAPAATRARDASGRYVKAETTATEQEKEPAGGDETPASGDAAPRGEGVQADWRDADVKDLAAAYGLDDETLAALPSREVLDVVLKGIDKKAFTERQAADAGAQSAATQQGQGQQSEQAGSNTTSFDLAKFKLPEDIDETARKPIEDFMEATAANMKALQAEVQQFQRAQAEQQFAVLRSTALDNLQKLGHTNLYGEPGKPLTKEQQSNVDAVLEDHFERGASLARRGGKPAPTPELLKRSVFALHGEQIIKQVKQEHLDKLKDQSRRRTGAGSTAPSAAPAGASPYERALRNLPALRREMDLE